MEAGRNIQMVTFHPPGSALRIYPLMTRHAEATFFNPSQLGLIYVKRRRQEEGEERKRPGPSGKAVGRRKE